jgi:hypothetical protein
MRKSMTAGKSTDLFHKMDEEIGIPTSNSGA